MSSGKESYSNLVSYVGALLLSPPLFIWWLWAQTFSANREATQPERVEIFLSHFPNSLQSVSAISTTVLVSCGAAIAVSAVGMFFANAWCKVLGMLVIIVGVLLELLQLFSMM